LDTNDGWALTSEDVLVKTADGGQSWQSIQTPNSQIEGACFTSTGNGLIATDNPDVAVYSTDDGGATWTKAASFGGPGTEVELHCSATTEATLRIVAAVGAGNVYSVTYATMPAWGSTWRELPIGSGDQADYAYLVGDEAVAIAMDYDASTTVTSGKLVPGTGGILTINHPADLVAGKGEVATLQDATKVSLPPSAAAPTPEAVDYESFTVDGPTTVGRVTYAAALSHEAGTAELLTSSDGGATWSGVAGSI